MLETNWAEVGELIDQLYQSTDALERHFSGRKFTLDGHLGGSVGEVVASYMFDLNLSAASTKGHDALCPDGRRVEIKLTQGKSVAIRHEPDHLLVLSRPKGATIEVIYNGPGDIVWDASGKMQKNGQRPIGLAKLAALNANLRSEQRIPKIRPAPV